MKSSGLLLTMTAAILYKVLLDTTYVFVQYPLFSYQGYADMFNITRYVITWFLYLPTAYRLLHGNKDDDICNLFLIVLFFLSITPFLTLFSFDGRYQFWMVVVQLIGLIIMGVLFSIFRWNANEARGRISYKGKAFRIAVTILLVAFFLYYFINNGLPNLSSLSFSNVYETRATAGLSTIDSLIQNAICKVICPLYVAIAFKERRWLFFCGGLFIQIYIYAITGYKTYLFIPLALLALQLFSKIRIKQTVVFAFPAIVLLADIAYIMNANMIYAVFANRLLFLPARIKWCYFDFFSTNDFVYFTQNTISRLIGIESPYDTHIANLIGGVYFNKESMWTNAGFMADAFANAGLVGVALLSVFLVVLLLFARSYIGLASEDMKRVLSALMVIFYISLNDGAVISVVFSGGMVFVLVLIRLVRFDDGKVIASNTTGITQCGEAIRSDAG